jgi:hypothetical protein
MQSNHNACNQPPAGRSRRRFVVSLESRSDLLHRILTAPQPHPASVIHPLDSNRFRNRANEIRRTALSTMCWENSGREGGILSDHPKKFSVVMVKRKPNRINGRFDEKPFCQCNWEI